MNEEHFYNVSMNWESDGKTVICSPELDLTNNRVGSCVELEIAAPPNFPKAETGFWSPEHMFTAAACSCLMTTFVAIAQNSKLEYTAFSCKGKGKLERVDGKYLMTEIILEPSVKVYQEKDVERAARIIEKSEKACLITNSMRSKVTLHPTINLAAVEA